jgi:hypothetical protein
MGHGHPDPKNPVTVPVGMAYGVAGSLSSKEHQGHCSHRWVVELSPGAVSKGQCNQCGSSKDFVNNVARHFYHPRAAETRASR